MPFTKIVAAGIDSSANINAKGINVSGIITANGLNLSGIITASGGYNLGIQSGGTNVTSGSLTTLNFIGAGNTFSYNSTTKTVDINIGGSQWTYVDTNNVSTSGVYRVNGNIGLGSTNPIQKLQVGSGTSQVFVVTGIGSVGIGTTNPRSRLHVVGDFLLAAGAATTQYITQKSYELNSGTVSWEGSSGQLFSITNNLTSGSIFSVNDVSGIPSIDVDASGTIELGPYGGNVAIGSTGLTGTVSQPLQVTGGAYVSGNLGVGVTNPSSKLSVVGNALITGITTVGLGTTSSPSNSQLTFELTSDTNLRIKVRGTDGVLRSANITLA